MKKLQGLYSFSFGGIKKDWIYLEDDSTERSAWAPISRNLLTIPGKPGAYLQSTTTNVRPIRQKIFYDGESREDLRKLEEELAEWLITEEPQELIFDDEPDRVYYALVDGSFDISEFLEIGEGTISFICPDPYKYSDERIINFPSDSVSFRSEGTAEADPIFELEVLRPVTFAMVQNQDNEYMLVGKPADVNTQIVDTKTLLIEETGTTINEWTTATSDMEGGSQGTIGYDGAGITAPSYGTGTGFHGPSVYKEVPLTGDFEIELRGQLYTDNVNQTGRFGFYLFDDEMREIAIMTAVDNSIYVERKLAEGRIGPFIGDFKNYLISSRNYQKEWDNFPAYMRLQRIGDKYTFYVARVQGDGKHMDPLTASWTVTEDKFRGKLKYVGIFIDKYGTTASPHTNRIDYIKAYALTEQTTEQIPFIAYTGDVITFDHTTCDILINGESRMDLKDFGANFFKLKKGINELYVLPDMSLRTKVRYKGRYK
ncbi:phage tail family protein [Lysinibacillus halotolerans]|uniref:Phage tail family protein n=1 Tax=Lysinibacillus halotolerans TaxID=1368476 RepID=A0A3M8H2D5_9BACI|nr:phage tail family protein [Lysinibacillus halotolerans]